MNTCIDPECAGCREAHCANWANCHGERPIRTRQCREHYHGRYCDLCRQYKFRHGVYPAAAHFAPPACCVVPRCERRQYGRGYCHRHHLQAWRQARRAAGLDAYYEERRRERRAQRRAAS